MRLHEDGAATSHLDEAKWNRLMSLLDELWPQLLAPGRVVNSSFARWAA